MVLDIRQILDHRKTQLGTDDVAPDPRMAPYPDPSKQPLSAPIAAIISHEAAEQLLTGFAVEDAEDKEFLSSMIASGRVAPDDMAELGRLGLMRGVEEWDMLMERAAVVRDKLYGGPGNDNNREKSLLPFLDLVLTGRSDEFVLQRASSASKGGRRARSVVKAKRELPLVVKRGVSHFWAEAGEREGHRGGERNKNGSSRQPHRNLANASPLTGGESHTSMVSPGGVFGEERPSELVQAAMQDAADEVTPHPVVLQGQQRADVIRQATYHPPGNDSVIEYPQLEPVDDKTQRPAVVAKARANRGGGTSPFFLATPQKAKVPSAGGREQTVTPIPGGATPSSPWPLLSPHKRKRVGKGISRLPIPPLSADRFGLIQEELAHDPFRLLIAVTFLIKTSATLALPVFWQLMARFPTPETLAAADPDDIVNLIRPLGLSANRCAVIQRYARTWLEQPPSREKRYGVKNYPLPGDGQHVRAGEEFGPEETSHFAADGELEGCDAATMVEARRQLSALGSAWEIGHFTQGPYTLDSWRIFCRDELLGRGKGNDNFQPEWMRVLPQDKELRAYLRWMWWKLDSGWDWDPCTGDREPLNEQLRNAVNEGRVRYDDGGELVIMDAEASGQVND